MKIITSVDPEVVQTIGKTVLENLRKFNFSKVGPYEFKPYTVHIVNDDNVIIGGLKGEIFERICNVQLAWVDEKERKKGVGTKLFKALENFARENHCRFIQLDTASFQARAFYEKIGFIVMVTLPEAFIGHEAYIMRKYLQNERLSHPDGANNGP